MDCDVLIAGAGFGGCLTALILNRLGYRVIVFDLGRHPRFSIGESSIPLADACLRELCQRYSLSGLAPLCTYGSVRRDLPHLVVGLKRGFSYFRHHQGREFASPDQGIVEQLLVAAASGDEQSDTHWLRSSVDNHFANQVREAGIPLWEETSLIQLDNARPWQVSLSHPSGGQRQVTANFLIDASGRSAVLTSKLRSEGTSGKPNQTTNLRTHSRAIFGHFLNIRPWQAMLSQSHISTIAHPFNCDHAAQHHLIDHGWMWQLRFDNGVTSAGFAVDTRHYSDLEGKPAQKQFYELLQRYPSLEKQMSEAQCVAPAGGIQATGRLQYLQLPAAGDRWASLPAAVGFVDPLHSTGIAHTFYSIRALTDILANQRWDDSRLSHQLQLYSQRMEEEIRLIDSLVSLAYSTLHDFDCFVASCMLYFAASTFAEHAEPGAEFNECRRASFLNADLAEFQQVIKQSLDLLESCRAGQVAWNEYPAAIERWVRPFNLVGLCDPRLNNMYSATSATHLRNRF